jgi:hypothetical protein
MAKSLMVAPLMFRKLAHKSHDKVAVVVVVVADAVVASAADLVDLAALDIN